MKKDIIYDHKIVAKNVKIIDENKNFLGIYSLEEALKVAKEKDLNLIQISIENNDKEEAAPICKIHDIKKYIYEKNKLQNKKVVKNDNKEFTFNTLIDISDLTRKLNDIGKKIELGYSVTLKMKYRHKGKITLETMESFVNNFFSSSNVNITSSRKNKNILNLRIIKKKK